MKNGIDVNFKNGKILSLLCIVCKYGCNKIVEFLFDNGVNVNLGSEDGFSFFIFVCDNGEESIV